MKALWDQMKGSKTYAVAGATIVYAVLGAILGYIQWPQAVTYILGALGLGALRNAI